MDIANDRSLEQNLYSRGLRTGMKIEIIPNPQSQNESLNPETESQFLSSLRNPQFFQAILQRYLR